MKIPIWTIECFTVNSVGSENIAKAKRPLDSRLDKSDLPTDAWEECNAYYLIC